MKKFIAPTVRVIKYDKNMLCTSATVGVENRDESGNGSFDPGDEVEYAPSRRIFGE